MSNNSSIISLILAEALVELPRITASDLFERCKDKLGNVSLSQFRIDLSKWLTDGTIPGYESRKGKTGGIYKKGAANESFTKEAHELSTIDPGPVALALAGILEVQTHITASSLYKLLEDLNLSITETEFKPLLSRWLKDGTIPGYEIKMGRSGETWVPKYYHPTITGAVNAVVRHIMNGEFKLSDSTLIQLKDTLTFLKELELRIQKQLQQIVDQKIAS